jgi:hypothetical protein
MGYMSYPRELRLYGVLRSSPKTCKKYCIRVMPSLSFGAYAGTVTKAGGLLRKGGCWRLASRRYSRRPSPQARCGSLGSPRPSARTAGSRRLGWKTTSPGGRGVRRRSSKRYSRTTRRGARPGSIATAFPAVGTTAIRGASKRPGPRRGMPAGVALFLSSWRQPCFAGFVSRSGGA